MPTYEYHCKSCGYEFEEFESMSSDPLLICPKCAEPSLKRLMSSGAGLLFKGSGFYSTDYKKSGAVTDTHKQTKELKPEPGSDSKKDTKKESKTEPKSQSKPSADKSSGTDKK
jgi:putative FmdB family regulatory protein